jgi:hypothetical protein
MRQSPRVLGAMAVLLVLFASGLCLADDLFADDFTAPGVDSGKWTVVGDGVSNPGGQLEVVCTYWWNDGVQSIPVFERPEPGDQLVIEGRFMMSADNPRCASIVWLQANWGHPYNGHALEFAKDQDEPGVHLIFYSTQEDDLIVEYEEVGVFEEGEWVAWRFVLYDVGCEALIDTGAGWEFLYGGVQGAFPVAINLQGSGNTSGGGSNTSFWDDIRVYPRASTLVEPSTWGAVKALFR